jgi:hypothetical protein
MPTRCYETNPGWMLLTYLWLWQFQTSLYWFLELLLWLQSETLIWMVPCYEWTNQIHTDYDREIVCQILLFWVIAAHICLVHAPYFSFDILDKWNINNQCSTSCVRPGHVMVCLIVFSNFLCPKWSKYYKDERFCWSLDSRDLLLSQFQ